MKQYILTIDSERNPRIVESYATKQAAFDRLDAFLEQERVRRELDSNDVPARSVEDWGEAWEYIMQPMDMAWIDEIEVDFSVEKMKPPVMPTPSRIAITVKDGMTDIVDSENWPRGLEVFLVDYDVEGADEYQITHVEGPCTITRWSVDDQLSFGWTGHFAKKCATAWGITS